MCIWRSNKKIVFHAVIPGRACNNPSNNAARIRYTIIPDCWRWGWHHSFVILCDAFSAHDHFVHAYIFHAKTFKWQTDTERKSEEKKIINKRSDFPQFITLLLAFFFFLHCIALQRGHRASNERAQCTFNECYVRHQCCVCTVSFSANIYASDARQRQREIANWKYVYILFNNAKVRVRSIYEPNRTEQAQQQQQQNPPSSLDEEFSFYEQNISASNCRRRRCCRHRCCVHRTTIQYYCYCKYTWKTMTEKQFNKLLFALHVSV